MVTPTVEPSRWPEHLPPFLRDAATFARDGRLWVQRTAPADAPPIFDVFDSECVRVEQVTLPPGREFIGFGRGSLYAGVRDELDLVYLERYRLEGAAPLSLPNLVEVQIQAAREALRTGGSGWEVFLDPRPELREDSVISLAYDRFVSEGFPVYDRPGIPGFDVRLLQFGGAREYPSRIQVSATLEGFLSRDSFLNRKGDIHIFRVDCDEKGCALGDLFVRLHADGSVSPECWADYFARSEEERRGC
jgi:hypothetical protein